MEETEKEMLFLCLGFSGPARVGRADQGWREAGKNQGLDGYSLCVAMPSLHLEDCVCSPQRGGRTPQSETCSLISVIHSNSDSNGS